MGRLPTGRRKYQLRSVQPMSREILRRIAAGQKAVDIAREMDITPVTVSYTKNSAVAQPVLKELERKRDEASMESIGRLADLHDNAVDVLEQIVTAEADAVNLGLKFRAAESILDRLGATAPKKIQGEITSRIIDADMLREVKKAALQTARESGIIVDKQFVEST